MNRIIHFEIHAKDMDAMQKFYNEVFDWTLQDMGTEMGDYRVITTGPMMPTEPGDVGINGGMTPRQGDLPKPTDAVNAYVCIIAVDDTDSYVEKVIRLGGTLALAAMDVPTVGRLAYCKDPEGNVFGMLTPILPATSQ
jgi:uncharacterized protein